MLKNNIKVAFRYLVRHKGYTFINVFGLAVGVACCILIMLFVRSEWSYDRFHSKADRIYRIWLDEVYEGSRFTNTTTPVPLAPAFQANIPEVEDVCRNYSFNALVKYGNNTFNEPINMVDSNFFRIFDFKILEGAQEPIQNHSGVVISKRLAKKYFGKDNALGKNLEILLGQEKVMFTVTAISDNIRQESSIRFDILIPFSNQVHLFSEATRTRGWQQVAVESYALLRKGTDTNTITRKIPAMVKQATGDRFKPGEYNLYLQPLTDIHLNNDLPVAIAPVSDPRYSYILATIGIVVLLIASINFVTLSIGRSTTRALEVGVRKVFGAEKKGLISQYWGEALLLTVLSFMAGSIFVILLLQPFNQLANRELIFTPDSFTIGFSVVMILIIAMIAGLYPAIVLSSFMPIQVLKGRMKSGNIGLFRKGLIVGQFVASIIMIIGTITIGKQLDYLQTKDLGYTKENIVIVPTNKRRPEGYPLAEKFNQALTKNPHVVSSSTSIFTFSEPGWATLGYTDDKNVFRQFRMNAIDADFLKTMNLQLIEGRDFEKNNPSDVFGSIIINEAMAIEYGWKNPLGKRIGAKYEQQVIGMVKDFNFESLHTPVQPLVLVMRPDSIIRRSSDISFNASLNPRISIRLRPGNLQDQIASLKTAWKSIAGDQDFEYRFLDEALNAAYEQEQRLGNMVRYASVLSIFIACMGLFGLATLVVTKRTKEIGIRKVLGADVKSIVSLLSKEFVWLVVIASLIAFPAAWWALNTWLQDFAYRIQLTWWVFISATIMALIVAIITVSVQAIRAALLNPVNSLRTE